MLSFSEEEKQRFQSLIFSLIDACKNNSSELEKASHLLQILTMLEKKKPSSAEQKLIPETLQKILDDINDNFLEIRSIQDVLTRHFVSSATLTRWFRKYLHTTPRKYVESVRLSNAARLLSQGSSVTNACMQSGFSDCSHFIALFKKKFSQTPSKYKKK